MLVEMSLSGIDDHTSSMAESINDVVRALEEQNEHLQTIAERLQKLEDVAGTGRGSGEAQSRLLSGRGHGCRAEDTGIAAGMLSPTQLRSGRSPPFLVERARTP